MEGGEMTYKVRDIKLAPKGKRMIEWAEHHMPVLMTIRREFSRTKQLKGLTVGAALHTEMKTAVLAKTLAAAGARVAIAGCNPLSTRDEVVAALAKEGVDVYAWHGETTSEYYSNLNRVLDHKPDILIDDGGDLIVGAHERRPELIPDILGATEETTTGAKRERVLESSGMLKFPVIDVNSAHVKYLMDNRYGTGQSALDGILRATNLLIAGKKFVIAGFGWVGRGIAMRAKGFGADVIVTEVDPIRALEATMEGYRVMSMHEAARIGDIFVTATGNIDAIVGGHMRHMKDGAILCNAGHFAEEVKVRDLEEIAVRKREVKENVTEYTLKNGRRLYLLSEGRLVNLACADGHPCEIMDLSFAGQALAVRYLKEHADELQPRVYEFPHELDLEIARMKLRAMGIVVNKFTKAQRKYLKTW
jgi:adenosylhomocysteinase